MADETVTVNGYVHDLEKSQVKKIQKTSVETTSWNGDNEVGLNKTAYISSSEETFTEVKSAQANAPATISTTVVNNVKEDENNGPDQILPANEYWTTEPSGRVKLRATEESLRTEPPISVPGLLGRAATLYPDRVAVSFKNTSGTWTEVTYKEYHDSVRTVAKAFIKLGLEKYHSVCIIGFNSIEWFVADLGAIFAGGFAAGMYTTNSAEACFFCLESSNANICVVEDDKQLQKILEVKHKLPNLKAIIQYSGEPKEPGVLSWEDVLKIGKEQSDEKLQSALKSIAVNECCTLVYTSGTEGKPKAVMLSHDNMTWEAAGIIKHFNFSQEKQETVISYLPLSHVAAQMADIYSPLSICAKVVFADKDALKGSLKDTLVEARPTIFMGVPRVWEKMYETLTSIGRSTTGLKKTLATWGKMATLQHHENCIENGSKSEPYRYKFYRWLIFDRIKQRMGLDRCKALISAAAPLSLDIKKYFMSIDILLIEAFGMSECSGGHTVGNYSKFSVTGVGQELAGVETKLDMKDGQPEICMRGRHVFMGYLNEIEKTQNALDSEGWLHSGDVGRIDENNNLHITGRSKELLITAGGENVAPVLIEQTVKSELPAISNAVLIGDKRKFLSILLTLRTETDSEGKPTDKLVKDVKNWCESLTGGTCETVSEVLNNPDIKKKVYEAIQIGINCANKKAISRAQNVQKFSLLPVDFAIGDELGPTLKIKRNVVYSKYTDTIEAFYEEAEK